MGNILPFVPWFKVREEESLHELAERNEKVNAIAAETLKLIRDMDTAHCFRDSHRRASILSRQAVLAQRLKELSDA